MRVILSARQEKYTIESAYSVHDSSSTIEHTIVRAPTPMS